MSEEKSTIKFTATKGIVDVEELTKEFVDMVEKADQYNLGLKYTKIEKWFGEWCLEIVCMLNHEIINKDRRNEHEYRNLHLDRMNVLFDGNEIVIENLDEIATNVISHFYISK